jgi:5'-3' exonuclease
MGARVYLVDGTMELFRCFHGAPRASNGDGREVGAARALFATLASLVHQPDVTHVAIAFDSVVPPPGHPSGSSPDGLIASQAGLAAEVARALGVGVWPSGRYQADELLATGAAKFAADPRVDLVVICSNDKDFHQCVRGERVVALDRIRKVVTDESVVVARYGVTPRQIPELFALVGDRSDGLPGVPGWGLKSAAALLGAYGTVEAIPLDPTSWVVDVRGATRLATALADRRSEALLCRDLSELRTDLPLHHGLDDLEWRGANRSCVDALGELLGDDSLPDRIERWRA